MLQTSTDDYEEFSDRGEDSVVRWEADTIAEGLTVHQLVSANIVGLKRHVKAKGQGYKNAESPDGLIGLIHDVWNHWQRHNDSDALLSPARQVITHWAKLDSGRIRGLTEYTHVYGRVDHTLPVRYFLSRSPHCDQENLDDSLHLTRRKVLRRILSNVPTGNLGEYRYSSIMASTVYEDITCRIDGWYAGLNSVDRLVDYYLSLPFTTFESLLKYDFDTWTSLPIPNDEETQKIVQDVVDQIIRRKMHHTLEQLAIL